MRSRSGNRGQHQVLRRARPLLGTIVDIRAEGAPAPALEAATASAFAAVERVQRLMSFHARDSDLARLNRQAARRPVAVDPWTFRVLEAAFRLWEWTGGLFDCAVAPALAAAGYLPRAAGLRPVRAGGRMGDVELLGTRRVRFARPLLLDLGGIAKGYAVDCAVDALQAAGVTQGAVNAGGDLRLFGARPEPVHVRDPEQPGALRLLGEFSDVAVATSSAEFAQREVAGRRVVPIVDPSSRALVRDLRSVTLLAADCLTADALTKPVLLSGAARPRFMARFGARALILG
jgi:thiamine biosynthesis lipoprotein